MSCWMPRRRMRSSCLRVCPILRRRRSARFLRSACWNTTRRYAPWPWVRMCSMPTFTAHRARRPGHRLPTACLSGRSATFLRPARCCKRSCAPAPVSARTAQTRSPPPPSVRRRRRRLRCKPSGRPQRPRSWRRLCRKHIWAFPSASIRAWTPRGVHRPLRRCSPPTAALPKTICWPICS